MHFSSHPSPSRVSCLQEELVSLRLQCSSVYRKGHFSQSLGTTAAEHNTSQRATDSGLTLGQTLLGAVGAVGAMGASLLRQPMSRSQLVAMSSSEDEGSLRFIYELLGWVEETQVRCCSCSFFKSSHVHINYLKKNIMMIFLIMPQLHITSAHLR